MKKKVSREQFMQISSAKAEESHHKYCKYECCGGHNDFVDFTKCPDCGMTEEIQDQHNDEWWACVDDAESQMSDEYEVIE